MKIRDRNRRHGGVTIAESALVLSMFLLFMFGIFEYGRFVFLTQVATNAARSGARYASINMDQASNFVATDADASTPSIKKYVQNQMGGADTMISGFNVSVFPCNPTKIYQDPPVIEAHANTVTWNTYTNTSVTPNRVDPVTFPDRIGVKILGNYQPILPNFIFKLAGNAVIPLNITACSSSEG
jgi:Flp pilus assembly protein TadG